MIIAQITQIVINTLFMRWLFLGSFLTNIMIILFTRKNFDVLRLPGLGVQHQGVGP